MGALIIVILVAFFVTATATALFLFLMSPLLMGNGVPASAKKLSAKIGTMLGRERAQSQKQSQIFFIGSRTVTGAAFINGAPQLVSGTRVPFVFETGFSGMTGGNVTSQSIAA
jgi:hypothetical protein